MFIQRLLPSRMLLVLVDLGNPRCFQTRHRGCNRARGSGCCSGTGGTGGAGAVAADAAGGLGGVCGGCGGGGGGRSGGAGGGGAGAGVVGPNRRSSSTGS